MKIQLPISELKPVLTGLGKIINKRPTLPVLGTVKIERTSDGWTTLTGTNLDQFVTARLEQPSEGEPAVILISLDDLTKTLKACGKSESIEIETTEEKTFLRYSIGTQSVDTPVDTLAPEEFPVIPRIKSEPIPVPDSLRESLHQAMACASTDETRYVLNGAFVDVSKQDCQQVVGTDGRQLYASNSFSLPLTQSLLIPACKFLQWKDFNNDGAWQIRVEEKADRPWFQLSTRRWRYLSRQIDGSYPNYRQVIPDPKSFRTVFELDAEGLTNIIAMIGRMPCHDAINQTIGLEIKDGDVSLIARAPQAETWTRLGIQTSGGRGVDVTVHMNRQFLAKGLEFGLNKIEIIDARSPLRLSNAGRQMIVMPVRVEPDPPNTPPTPVETKPPTNNPPPVPEAPIERNAMVTSNQQPTEPAPATLTGKIDEALETIDALQDTLKDGLTSLKELSGKLKAIQRDHKTTDRELQGFRNTIRSLQTLKV